MRTFGRRFDRWWLVAEVGIAALVVAAAAALLAKFFC
jgi:hypothetical protein